jgi:hypothetical protein
MTRLVTFGAYTFADVGVRWRDNFAQIAPREVELPGLSGALDLYGEGAGAHAAGRIDVSLWLKADTPAAMLALRDGLKALIDTGTQTLVVEAAPGVQRSTRARLLTVELPESYTQRPDVTHQAALTFAAETPRWFSVTAPSGSGVLQVCSGAQTDLTRTANGSATTCPMITVNATDGVNTITIQRRVGVSAADQVAYNAAIPNGATLIIDPRSATVTLNGADAYTAAFSAQHPAWMRLLPGANTIRVMLNAGASASIALTWLDCWY